MIGIADHRLIEIANLHMDFAVRRGERSQIAGVPISANPNGRALGNGAVAALLQPSIELNGAAAHIGMRGTRHFERSALVQRAWSIGRGWESAGPGGDRL